MFCFLFCYNQTMQINPKLIDIDKCLYRVSVKALIIDKDKILLVKEWDDEWWSFPGGGIEHGESMQLALYREISEELGIEPKDIKSNLRTIHTGIGAVVEKLPMTNLFVRVEIPVDKIKPSKDVIEYKWFSFKDLGRLLIVPTTLDTDQLLSAIQKQLNLVM